MPIDRPHCRPENNAPIQLAPIRELDGDVTPTGIASGSHRGDAYLRVLARSPSRSSAFHKTQQGVAKNQRAPQTGECRSRKIRISTICPPRSCTRRSRFETNAFLGPWVLNVGVTIVVGLPIQLFCANETQYSLLVISYARHLPGSPPKCEKVVTFIILAPF